MDVTINGHINCFYFFFCASQHACLYMYIHAHTCEVTQSRPTLSDPMDCSLPGSSVHGIFQARVLEWVGISCTHILTRISVNF